MLLHHGREIEGFLLRRDLRQVEHAVTGPSMFGKIALIVALRRRM
jgi:hypothetical protein